MKLRIFAVVVSFPHLLIPCLISWGWCLATPSAIQIPRSRKQHQKVCDANAIYWCVFHFPLTFETVDFSSELSVHSPTEMHFSLEGEEVEGFTTAWEVSMHPNEYQGKVYVRKRFWGFGWCFFSCLPTGIAVHLLKLSEVTKPDWSGIWICSRAFRCSMSCNGLGWKGP